MSDGLVNGARGEVVHIVTNDNNDVTIVLVKFDCVKLMLVKKLIKPVGLVQCIPMLYL